MITMQYNISLPSDYDMEIIKNRVRNNGSKTDAFPDLYMKAYLIAEKTKYNNSVNQYAPFYLWEKEEGMNQFLLDGPFHAILNSFGRPIVYNWMVLHAHVNKIAQQQFAIVQIAPIHASLDFRLLCTHEEENYRRWIDEKSTTAYITAYNPQSWEWCHFHMSTDIEALKKIANGSLIFDVYHIS